MAVHTRQGYPLETPPPPPMVSFLPERQKEATSETPQFGMERFTQVWGWLALGWRAPRGLEMPCILHGPYRLPCLFVCQTGNLVSQSIGVLPTGCTTCVDHLKALKASHKGSSDWRFRNWVRQDHTAPDTFKHPYFATHLHEHAPLMQQKGILKFCGSLMPHGYFLHRL